jgi:iron complex outermembrane receptor protein
MNRNSERKFLGGFAFALNVAIAFAVSSEGLAQTAPAPAPIDDQPVRLQSVVVTGSNIPMAADALAVPVQVVGPDTIKDSGVPTNTLDLLRKVAPNISGVGGENATISTGTNFGGASVSIKNLTTLVLLDGRRVVSDPAESAGGSQFVDLNMIPVAAIDRIEVLQDGASAIYGSDAVGGVINIILKKNYNGWEIGGHFGLSTAKGHYQERSGYMFGGVSTDKTSITLSFEVAQSNPLYDAARPFTNPIYGTYTYPGSLEVYNNSTGADNFYSLAPGVNAPPGGSQYTIQQLVAMGVYVPKTSAQAFQALNLANAQTLIQSLKRYSAMANWEHKIFDDKLVAFGNVLYTHTATWSSLNGQPLVPYLQDPWVDLNVFGYLSSPPPAGTTFVPVTAPGNPFSQTFLDDGQSVKESAPGNGDGSGYEILARERFLNYPRLYQNASDMYRIVGGLKGDISEDYHWEMAANINRYTLAFTNPGLIDTNALNNALVSGQVNPFAIVQAPGAFNGVVGTAFVNMLSTLNEFDFKVDGTPFTLPGGKVGFAVGVSYVLEGLSEVPDVNSLPNSSGTTQGWSNATTYQQFSAHRDFDSFFGEVNIPLTGSAMAVPGAYAINVDGAIRYDSYSGKVGSSTDPQGSVSWQPFDTQLKLRATAGKSFLAPQLYNLYGPVSAGSTADITYTSAAGAKKQAQFNQTGGSNPALKPSTANSWTAGFVYTPNAIKGLEISADYSDIYQKAVFGTVPAATIIQNVETAGASSPYVGLVHFNTPTGPTATAPGAISSRSPQQIYVIQNLLNLSGQRIDSTDIKVDYAWKTSLGKFDVSSVWTWYNRYLLQQIPTEPYYNYVGQASTTQGTTIPRWRTYTTVDWNVVGFDAFVGMTYVESVMDVGVGGSNQSSFTNVPSFTAFDLGLGYDFGHLHMGRWLDGLSIQIGVNNVANKLPPLAPVAFPETNSDVGTYDGSIGRMWYVDAKYKF